MRVVPQEFDPSITVKDLIEYPDNANRGDVKAVEESISANGFYGAILVQKSSKRILAGHTRLKVAREEGAETIPGFWLDVTDEEARKILLSDNRTANLAYTDDESLFKLLASVLDDGGTLVGTGYDNDTYKLLLNSDEDGLYAGNVRQGPTPHDDIAGYEASDIRSIILPYAGETYDEVVEGLTFLRADRDLQTNAEVILDLIRKARET